MFSISADHEAITDTLHFALSQPEQRSRAFVYQKSELQAVSNLRNCDARLETINTIRSQYMIVVGSGQHLAFQWIPGNVRLLEMLLRSGYMAIKSSYLYHFIVQIQVYSCKNVGSPTFCHSGKIPGTVTMLFKISTQVLNTTFLVGSPGIY